ncbi:hypothetical protein V502_00474 [Pseudogymnoascus sp. VKM F-4520 (FW-2644)]|nr:hypothetical protein V502_00474 [Pseudogymnoascus sp. VKM F-4520 (FW-2644)]
MAAPRPSKFVQIRLPPRDLPSPETIALPGIDEPDGALPPRASRKADLPPHRVPAQVPAFPFRAASGIPRGAYTELRAPGIAPLQPRDLMRVRGSVPRWYYGRVAQGERPGPLQYEWDGGEEAPWPNFVPFQGAAEGSLAGRIEMDGERMGEIVDPVPRMRRVSGLPSQGFFDPIFLGPLPEYQFPPPLLKELELVDPYEPISLPAVFPRPRRFYRVQHSAAIDWRGNETCPPSRTRDSAVLGLSAETIFPPCFERRINRANLERALDPMNVQPTSLVALYSNYGMAVFDFEMHRQMECADVYIAHIAAETFTCGTIPVMVTPPGQDEAQEVHLPTVGLKEPRVLLFPVLSCMEILGIETEMTVSGVWFAIDSVPAQFIERREARGLPLDWARRDGRWARPGAGQPWEEWGEEGMVRFGVDGVEVVEDEPPPDEDIPSPKYPHALSIPVDEDSPPSGEDMPPPSYPHALSIPVDEEERNGSRSPSSFVDDETPDNTRSASRLVEETPDTTRSPEVSRAVHGSAGPSAAGSSRISAARVSESTEDDDNDEDGDENEDGDGNEEESAWRTELQDLINKELSVVVDGARDVADAPKSPSLGYPSPKEGLFIYDSCQGMW